jgi:glycerophosphoryl diester phosphodiesterase
MLSFDIQGHRGARGLSPENTLPGFARALAIGVTTLELDMGMTRDGVLVVSHDPILNPDHTRDPAGQWLEKPGPSLFSLRLEELRRFDVGRLRPGSAYAARFPEQQGADGVPIPTLQEVLGLVRRSGNASVLFNIETKLDPRFPDRTPGPEDFVDAFLKVVRESEVTNRVTLQSFDWRTLRYARGVAPEIATSCLTVEQPGEDNIQAGRPGRSPWLAGLAVADFAGSVPRLVKAAGAGTWSPDATTLTPALVVEAHSLGLRVLPWTVNEPGTMAALIDAAVDGLISDRPDLLRQAAAGRGRPLPPQTPVAP